METMTMPHLIASAVAQMMLTLSLWHGKYSCPEWGTHNRFPQRTMLFEINTINGYKFYL